MDSAVAIRSCATVSWSAEHRATEGPEAPKGASGHDGGMHALYEIEPGNLAAVVTLRGELDAHDAPRLREVFQGALDELDGRDGACLVLDLTGVAFLDSTALGVLVGGLRRVREAGGEMPVVLPETTARRIFEITGLDQVLSVYPTRAAALAA